MGRPPGRGGEAQASGGRGSRTRCSHGASHTGGLEQCGRGTRPRGSTTAGAQDAERLRGLALSRVGERTCQRGGAAESDCGVDEFTQERQPLASKEEAERIGLRSRRGSGSKRSMRRQGGRQARPESNQADEREWHLRQPRRGIWTDPESGPRLRLIERLPQSLLDADQRRSRRARSRASSDVLQRSSVSRMSSRCILECQMAG